MTYFQIKLVDTAINPQQLELRPLIGDDAPLYFEQRCYILSIGDGHFFSDSYERERALETEQLRRDWCTEKHGHCILGAFCKGELVGFVMITQYGPPEDLTVEWEAAWVNPLYRKTGLAKALYEEVEQWTVDHGYRFVKSFIREDNKSWLDIRRKLGFVEIGTKYVSQWADGTSGNMVILKRDLYALRPQLQKHKTIRYLQNTITALEYPHTVPLEQNKNDVAF